MELTESLKTLFIQTANSLKGSVRRLFMARTVAQLGEGGQRLAQRELGWNRATIRKGAHELRTGITCCDGFALRGRQPGYYCSSPGNVLLRLTEIKSRNLRLFTAPDERKWKDNFWTQDEHR